MTTPLPILPEPISIAHQIAGLTSGSELKLGRGLFSLPCDNVANVIRGDNIHIYGAGSGLTTIRRELPEVGNQPVLRCIGDNVTVDNLTLDANGSDTDRYVHAGLQIDGRNAKVRNVEVINASGQKNLKQECWAFFIVTDETQPTGLVQDCLVTNVHGDYVRGFAFGGTDCGGNIVRCRAEFPHLTALDGPIFAGFQAAGSSRIIDCTQDGGMDMFYTDTNSSRYMRISGCLGTNLLRGVWISVQSGQSCDGLTVRDCLFELLPGVAGNRYGVAVSGPGDIRNVRVANNAFRWADGEIMQGFRWFAAAVDGKSDLPGINLAKNTRFEANTIEQGFDWASENGNANFGTVYAARI